MNDVQQPLPLHYSAVPPAKLDVSLVNLYLAEAFTAIASTLMSVGIYFFTARVFQWDLKQNFRLAVTQGFCYIAGALLAGRLAQRWGRRRILTCQYLVLVALMIPPAFCPTVPVVCAVLLTYTFVVATSWPVLESLASGNGTPGQISRRLSMYNLVWSLIGSLTLALTGRLIETWPSGVFLIPVAVHVLSAAMIWFNKRLPDHAPEMAQSTAMAAEPELHAQRRLALWLSRIALPATYVVVYGLSPMLPSLAVIRRLSLSQATALGSVWLAGRCLAFLLLSLHGWWHTHPRALLWAAFAMLAGFLGTLLFGGMPAEHQQLAIVSMILWQLAVGLSLGMIYSGSLYFGMVLSEGSTEHGGYHEALIGLGQVLGPLAGVTAQWISPGNIHAGIGAVAGVIALSVIAATVAAIRTRPTAD